MSYLRSDHNLFLNQDTEKYEETEKIDHWLNPRLKFAAVGISFRPALLNAHLDRGTEPRTVKTTDLVLLQAKAI